MDTLKESDLRIGNFYYKHKQIYAVHKLQNLVYELKDEELILNNK